VVGGAFPPVVGIGLVVVLFYQVKLFFLDIREYIVEICCSSYLLFTRGWGLFLFIFFFLVGLVVVFFWF